MEKEQISMDIVNKDPFIKDFKYKDAKELFSLNYPFYRFNNCLIV